jgi:hypothetical protein
MFPWNKPLTIPLRDVFQCCRERWSSTVRDREWKQKNDWNSSNVPGLDPKEIILLFIESAETLFWASNQNHWTLAQNSFFFGNTSFLTYHNLTDPCFPDHCSHLPQNLASNNLDSNVIKIPQNDETVVVSFSLFSRGSLPTIFYRVGCYILPFSYFL